MWGGCAVRDEDAWRVSIAFCDVQHVCMARAAWRVPGGECGVWGQGDAVSRERGDVLGWDV